MAYLDAKNLGCVFLDEAGLRARALDRRQCGRLRITSGHIVTCDPLVQPDMPAYPRPVTARGPHAVEVVRHLGRHALAVLWLRARESCDPAALRWEAATLDGEATDTLGPDEYRGYPVDSGLGCFMDRDASAAMAERSRQHAADPVFDYYNVVLAPEMGDDDVLDHYPLGPNSANNIIIFGSGWGDGSYPSFWALDPDGTPAALVTDFMIIQDGDARSKYRRRADAYRASLSPEKIAALENLAEAVSRDDAAGVRALLGSGLAGANEVVPTNGETAISTAIRLDKPDMLALLLGGGPVPTMPNANDLPEGRRSYLGYARYLNIPRSPALMALLER